MIDLLERADPARGAEANAARIRAKIDERIGISAPVKETKARRPTLDDRCRLIRSGDLGRRSLPPPPGIVLL